MRLRLTIRLCLGGVGLPAQSIDDERDVRPILSDRCFACHGPDESHRMANLRLDTPEGASGAARRLYERITSPGRSRMPPAASGPALTAVQKEIIRRWIEQGARAGLGIDHKRLTYKFQGRDLRLTDVAGAVVSRILA